MPRGGANRKPPAARQQYFELVRQGLKGAAAARQVGVSTSCGSKWGDEVLATAILDRLLHHCDVVAINGPSYRLKNRLEAIERDTNVA